MPPVSRLGAIPLGAAQQVVVNDIRILPMAGVQFARGGCDMPGKVMRLEVVDVPRQAQTIIPFDIGFAERLHKQLGELIAEHNKRTLEA